MFYRIILKHFNCNIYSFCNFFFFVIACVGLVFTPSRVCVCPRVWVFIRSKKKNKKKQHKKAQNAAYPYTNILFVLKQDSGLFYKKLWRLCRYWLSFCFKLWLFKHLHRQQSKAGQPREQQSNVLQRDDWLFPLCPLWFPRSSAVTN